MLREIEYFVNWIRQRNLHARTWRDYRYDLKLFVAVVGDQPPEDITVYDVDRFVINQSEQGLKAATINRRLAAVMSFYTFLSDENPRLICPVFPHRHLLKTPRCLPRPVQAETLKKFFAVIDDQRDRAMFFLMLRCGLRISEVARLRLSQLYLNEPLPRLVVRGKGNRERAVYLSPQAEQMLRNWLRIRPPVNSEHVFISYLGLGMSTTAIHKRLMCYRETAEVHLTAHQLRHTFANDLLNADVPVTSIQKLLGHVWLESTQTYVLANDKQVQADYQAACSKLEGWQ